MSTMLVRFLVRDFNFSMQISMHQSFKLNNTNYYTIFDLPISVTNRIDSQTSEGKSRAPCNLLMNALQSDSDQRASANFIPQARFPWTNGQGTESIPPDPSNPVSPSSISPGSQGGSNVTPSNGAIASGQSYPSPVSSNPKLGGQKPEGKPSDGLGSGASFMTAPAPVTGLLCFASVLFLLIL